MKRLNEIFCKKICLTSKSSIMVMIAVFISGIVVAGVISASPKEEIKVIEKEPESEIWIPTQEDIQYQDSMFQIIQQTQYEVDTIKIHINDILEKIEELDK
tara:strand:+ start:5870 stop:6172 length:303 start_codon:yes stop_codon:yes gene_type:complete